MLTTIIVGEKMELSDFYYALASLLSVKKIKQLPVECTRNVSITFVYDVQEEAYVRIKGLLIKEIAQKVNEFLAYEQCRSICFGYRYLKPLCKIENCISRELADVISKLPKLSSDCEYVFPVDTYIIFNKQNDGPIQIKCSDNIKEIIEEVIGKKNMHKENFC